MANVLDLRRRIRSVKNTRQITKAMKMVSAAKLRRAQDRAMRARPYARMLATVLVSLVRRTDLYNEQTGEILHPLLVEREEKNVLAIVIAGDKVLPGRSTPHRQAAQRSSTSGARWARPSIWSRWAEGDRALQKEGCGGHYEKTSSTTTTTSPPTTMWCAIARSRSRWWRSIPACCCGWISTTCRMSVFHHRALSAAEIDSVYLVYNEFKSVISPAPVWWRSCCPSASWARERLPRPRDDPGAARGCGAGCQQRRRLVFEMEDKAAESEAKFGTAEVDYIYDQAPEQLSAA